MKSSTKQNVQKYDRQRWIVPFLVNTSATDEGIEYEYDEVIIQADTAEDALHKAINARIDDYDRSANVNSFSLGGTPMWLPLEERKSMRQSLIALKAEGIESFTYWNGLTPITMPVAQFEAMLNAVEVYALRCFNITAQHKANVSKLTTLEALQAYDITEGYPQRLSF